MTAEPLYQERDVLALPDESISWRILHCTNELTIWFERNHELAFPQGDYTSRITADLVDGKLIKLETDDDCLANVSDASRAHALKKLDAFKSILMNRKHAWDAMFESGRGSVMEALRETYPRITHRVFHKALRQWWGGDGTAASFIPDWPNCGRTKIDITKLDEEPLSPAIAHTRALAVAAASQEVEPADTLPDHNKTGHRRKRVAPARGTAFPVDRQVLRVFLDYYKQKDEGKSLTKLHTKMSGEVFVRIHDDGSKEALPESAVPSIRCFQAWYQTLVGHKQRRIAKVGEIEFAQTGRELLSNEYSSVERAGEKASADATIWNVAVISRFAGQRVVGPPVVFRIRCKKSGLLLGLSVSLENASWTGVGAAMVNCLEDKVAFCARYGVKIQPEDWPVRGLPGHCELDRGESDNHHPQSFVEETGIGIENLQGQRPDMKPGVESDFRTLQVSLNGYTPSAIVKTWANQQNTEWKLEAKLTLDQFIGRLLRHELDRMKQPRAGFEMSPEMIDQGYSSSPLNVWNFSRHNQGGGLVSKSINKVMLAVMRREPASLTPHGLEFRDCIYLAEDVITNEDYSKARGNHGTIEVAFDTRLVDKVYVVKIGGKKVQRPIECTLSPKRAHQRGYTGKCFAEVAELKRQEAINAANHRAVQHASARETMRADLEENAEVKRTAIPVSEKGSKAKQLREIPVARKAEMYADAPGQAFKPDLGSAPVRAAAPEPAPPPPTPAPQQSAPSPAATKAPPLAPAQEQPRPAFFRRDDTAAFAAYMNGGAPDQA